MAKISELTVRQGNVDVEGTMKEIGEIKTFNKFGRELRVADAMLEDDSGTVKLSLWNDDVSKFKAGDKVKITNGYVNEFQGEKQLTAGKFGKMELADGASQEELPKEGSEDESLLEKAGDKIKEVAEDVKEKVEEVVDKVKGDKKSEEKSEESTEAPAEESTEAPTEEELTG